MNVPFDPLFGSKSVPKEKDVSSHNEMEQLGKKLLEGANQLKQSKVESEKINLGDWSLDKIYENKNLLIAIFVLLLLLIIGIIIYTQSKQKKSISSLSKKIRMLKAE